MQTSSQISFKSFIKEISNLPVWIKQIIYMELKEQLENSTIKSCINMAKKEECLQLYIPKLTYKGKKELESKTKKHSKDINTFLEFAFQNFSIMEIAINNNWNLNKCSNCFIKAINADLIVNPSSSIVKGTALYMSGEIRLGEYFVKIEKITIKQLDEALNVQKHLEESLGDKQGLGKILVNLNFLNKNDTEGILLLKEDCQKYYELNLINPDL